MHGIKRWRSDLMGLLFPDLCNGCGISLVYGEEMICTTCLYDMPFTDYHLHAENRVAKQLWGRLPLKAAMAMLYFRKGEKVQNMIHNLKYNGRTEIGIILGRILGERLKISPLYAGIDMIIPVPLHKKKFRERGFNQSTFIAEGIAEKMDVPFFENQLIRVLSTASQTKKNRFSRFENMIGVFKISDPAFVVGKHILLVDDVLTTGSTIEACANELLAAGASNVSIATLAFAD